MTGLVPLLGLLADSIEVDLPEGRANLPVFQVAMGVLALAGLIISAMTVYNSVQASRAKTHLEQAEHELSDTNNGSLRQVITQGFKRSDNRMDEILAKHTQLETRVAEVSDSNQQIRRHLQLNSRDKP